MSENNTLMSVIQAGSLPQYTGGTQSLAQLADRQGGVLASNLNAYYAALALGGKMFSVAIQSVATTTVGLATTYTGLCLSNPVSSTVNLVLTKASMMQSVIQATQVEAYALAFGFNATTDVTHTAALTPQSTYIGSGLTSAARADTSATLPTAPVYGVFVSNTGTATADSTGNMVFDLDGSYVLKPGAYVCWVTPAQASVAGLWFSFQWAELPV
jgi:hypothetical protein